MGPLVGLIILGAIVWAIIASKPKGTQSTSSPARPTTPTIHRWEFADVFRKRRYLFNATSEFNTFKVLNELFGDRYLIFPQINLGHLIEPKDRNFYTRRANFSRIEKKSVDFVLCDKIQVVPRLAIELDGSSHNRRDRQERDHFVDELMKDVGLKILHLRVGTLTRELIKAEVEKAFLPSDSPK